VTAGAPEISAIVEDLFSVDGMHGMHDIYRGRGDVAELQRRITKLMDSVACLGADIELDRVPTSRYLYRSRKTSEVDVEEPAGCSTYVQRATPNQPEGLI